MIEVCYDRGVYLPQQDLWLDPWDAKRFAFISHAHSDHIAPHEEIIISERTSRLLESRLPGRRTEHVLPFGEQRSVRGLDIMLLPAGHIFGSAQFFLSVGDETLLYTGDFKLRPGKSAEQAQWHHSDTLIMETTFGLRRYRFPSTQQVIDQIICFCRETIQAGDVPVLLGYSLGKAQEILCSLDGAGLSPMLHGAVYQMTRIYEQFGQSFCKYVRYNANEVAGKVLICPPSANGSPMLERIKRKRVALITGWAVDPNAVYRYRVDAAFPLSDHADYDDLQRYVELVQPRRVLTLHGFAAAFAVDLRERGIDAWALSEENQLEFTLSKEPMRRAGVSFEKDAARGAIATENLQDRRTDENVFESEFLTFANVGEAIAATPAKLEKVRLLAEYLRELPSDALSFVTTYFTGRAFAQSDLRTLQVGWSVVFRALQAATKIEDATFHRIAGRHGDAGKSAFEILDGRTTPQAFSIVQSRELFENLHRARGPSAKAKLLETRFASSSAREGEYIVKILTGDLRIGLREGLVEEAIARAFDVPLEHVKQANMLLGDIGQTGVLASRKELDRAQLSLFRPIKCMLASPEPTAEAVWKRFAVATNQNPAQPESTSPATACLEDKFDGIRAQLHCSAERVEIFSRDLRRITTQFPELADRATNFQDELIVDGEIIAFEEGRKLTFFDLQKRLGRKSDGEDLFARVAADVPVAFVVFDLLWLNGESLLKTPLHERRARLSKLRLPAQFQLASVAAAHSADEIEQAFRDARRRSNEGLMIKDPQSFYLPGTRGMFWFKLKKELATLDVVVVAAELGHGKRNNVLSDYTFAVRDESTDDLLPIGKAYSGLTDAEIAELTEHFKQNTIVDHGRYREVKPNIVLEVAFNSIQPSTRHASGLALRFPRIKAIRRDKNVDSIDTLQYARELAAGNARIVH
ncbi:MAG TPA: ATP-dependent DNA ligase [Candidatus Udaeobacter sp.]|jgi:DNA ligase-1|nr:ATP-dependent DNA ligase [Candidatus Udaeobacter sp.]